ncbi:MAG: hypothetical protein ABR586_00140 [Thermoplasmatota archaeon]
MKRDPVPLILGHNQFIGVDHLSQERARERQGRFDDQGRILDLLRVAVDAGVEGLMVSTHAKLKETVQLVEGDPTLRGRLAYYPIVPYAQGYVVRANQIGIPGLALESIRQARAKGSLRMMLRSARAAATRNPKHFIGPLVDMELAAFRGANVDAVFLHNSITDLLVGWNAIPVLKAFQDHVERHYDARAGFATFNFPLLMDRLRGHGLRRPVVLTSFNPVGFQMSPGRAENEAALRRDEADVVAMSIFAAGYVKPAEAFAYLKGLPGIRSAVFGASSPQHVTHSAKALQECLGPQPPLPRS